MTIFLSWLLLCGAAFAGPAPSLEAQSAAAGAAFDGARPLPAAFKAPAPAQDYLTLSELAERLAADPRTLDALVEAVKKRLGEGRGWPGAGALEPAAREKLARALKSVDKAFLDSFPMMTLPELRAFLAAYATVKGPVALPPAAPAEEDLSLTGLPKDPKPGEFLSEVAPGLYYGDKSRGPLASAHGDSVRLAEVLNRLADNDPAKPAYALKAMGARFTAARAFIDALLAAGHTLEISDKRFFANFGDLWLLENGALKSVATPFWVKTGIPVPGGGELLLPVAHTHIEISLRGSAVNADLLFFFGVDGAPSFRALSTSDQPWVGGREVGRWDGVAAAPLIERAATVRRELGLKARRHGLPLGGYGPLGACGDVNAMVTGKLSWPMIRDPLYFKEGMEIDAWSAALPIDAAGPADLPRVLDSLPAEPGEIPLPTLREQLEKILGAKR